MTLTQVTTHGIKDGAVATVDLNADVVDGTWTLGASGTDHYTFTGDGLTGAVNDPEIN